MRPTGDLIPQPHRKVGQQRQIHKPILLLILVKILLTIIIHIMQRQMALNIVNHAFAIAALVEAIVATAAG